MAHSTESPTSPAAGFTTVCCSQRVFRTSSCQPSKAPTPLTFIVITLLVSSRPCATQLASVSRLRGRYHREKLQYSPAAGHSHESLLLFVAGECWLHQSALDTRGAAAACVLGSANNPPRPQHAKRAQHSARRATTHGL